MSQAKGDKCKRIALEVQYMDLKEALGVATKFSYRLTALFFLNKFLYLVNSLGSSGHMILCNNEIKGETNLCLRSNQGLSSLKLKNINCLVELDQFRAPPNFFRKITKKAFSIYLAEDENHQKMVART